MMLSDLVEAIAAKVHEQWMATKRAEGVTSRVSELGEEMMVPYAALSDPAKSLDRGTVKAVLEALMEAGFLGPSLEACGGDESPKVFDAGACTECVWLQSSGQLFLECRECQARRRMDTLKTAHVRDVSQRVDAFLRDTVETARGYKPEGWANARDAWLMMVRIEKLLGRVVALEMQQEVAAVEAARHVRPKHMPSPVNCALKKK